VALDEAYTEVILELQKPDGQARAARCYVHVKSEQPFVRVTRIRVSSIVDCADGRT